MLALVRHALQHRTPRGPQQGHGWKEAEGWRLRKLPLSPALLLRCFVLIPSTDGHEAHGRGRKPRRPLAAMALASLR